MQVSLNTYRNYANRNNNNSLYGRSTAYTTAGNSTAQNVAFSGWFGLPSGSKFLEPLNKGFDAFTDKIARYYTKPLYQSKAGKWLAWQKDSDQIVNHMQSIGSIIVSGMYMSLTLKNKNMDEETKKKLSINQGLTWLAATLGAYGLDSVLDSIWDKHVSLKHASKFLCDPENKEFADKQVLYKKLVDDWEKHNKELKKMFDAKPAAEKKGFLGLRKKFKPISATKFIEKTFNNGELVKELKGLDVIKSLVIFGTMYRFISPVAVTPIANMIGDLIFTKHEKKAEQQLITDSLILQRPLMANFVGGLKK